MYFFGDDFEELCESNCRRYKVYADVYLREADGVYPQSPSYTFTHKSVNGGPSIVSVKIVRGLTSGSFEYGGAFSGQLTLVATANANIPPNGTKIVISVAFVSDSGAETAQKAPLGTFYTESVATSLFTKTVKATDGIAKLTKYYVPDESEYPLKASKLFEKAADLAGASIAFGIDTLKLNDPNITEPPLKKKGVPEGEEDPEQEVYVVASGTGEKYHTNPQCSGMNGNVTAMTRAEAEAEGYAKCTKKACLGEEVSEDEYYTYREIAGMIASVNAGNAFVDSHNYLRISTPDIGLKRDIPIKSVINYTDNEVVNEFTTTFWAQTYDGEGTPPEIDPLSVSYDPSIMVIDFPLANDGDYAVMQKNIDSKIGGVAYNGIVIKRQGTGRQEIGDLLAFKDTYRNKTFDNVLVMGIVYDISAQGGFTETLYSLSQSEAKQQAKGISTNTRVDRLENKTGAASGGVVSGGVGEFTNEDKNSEIFNSYKDVINENGAITTKKNYINPKTPFAHVGGSGNSIDKPEEGETLDDVSGIASILGGHTNKIIKSAISAILCGQNNSIQDDSAMAAITAGGSHKIIGSIGAAIVCGERSIIQNAALACIAGGTANESTSALSFIGAGMFNKISSSNVGNSICGGNANKIKNEAAFAFIGGGINNEASGDQSAIIGGQNNKIQSVNSDSAILAGQGNQMLDSYACAIISGYNNGTKKEVNYSAIISGSGNMMFSGGNSVILGGSLNNIGDKNQAGSESGDVILGGYENAIKYSSYWSTVLYGDHNFIGRYSNSSCVGGSNNRLNDSPLCTVFGSHNQVDDISLCFICGMWFDTVEARLKNASFVIGGGLSEDYKKNIFYVTNTGDVYAHSFNIIGETASEASAFSAKSVDSPDISELVEQINQMKSDIETLKSKNEELRAEVEKLKQ